jgi:sugar phosphate isomerase/epimerase
MNTQLETPRTNRRAFLTNLALCGGAVTLSGSGTKAQAATTDWSKLIGIQLTVIRDEMAKGVEPALAKLAEIGYKVVQPVGFSGLDAKEYRAILDGHGLAAAYIDQGFSTGADIEKDLESCRILGCHYAEPRPEGGGRGGAAGGRAAGLPAAGAAPGTAAGGDARGASAGPAAGRGRGSAPPETEETTKRIAAAYNGYGKLAGKFGMKVIYHHHIEHFELLAGTKTTFFDLFLEETDPNTVAMEFDTGYTAIAGRSIPETLKRFAGRFPVWDVRDAFGLKAADTNSGWTPNQRRQYVYSVPVGLGEVDFRSAFANADTAGLKYFGVVQDNAATWGDSVAVARVSFQNMTRLLAAA